MRTLTHEQKMATLEAVMSQLDEKQFYHLDDQNEKIHVKFTYWVKQPYRELEDWAEIQVLDNGWVMVTYFGGKSKLPLFRWSRLWLDDKIKDICTDFYGLANRQSLYIVKKDSQNIYCGLSSELERLKRLSKNYESRKFIYSVENVQKENALLLMEEREHEVQA